MLEAERFASSPHELCLDLGLCFQSLPLSSPFECDSYAGGCRLVVECAGAASGRFVVK